MAFCQVSFVAQFFFNLNVHLLRLVRDIKGIFVPRGRKIGSRIAEFRTDKRVRDK